MAQMMNQTLYWDSAAGKKTFTIPLRLDLFRRCLCGEKDAEAVKQSVILDYGCGYGRTLAELRNAGFDNLHGVDFSARMLEEARAYLSRAVNGGNRKDSGKELSLRLSATGIPYGDGFFDAVILLALLTCITGNDELAALLAEIRRVLKPGGILYVGDFLLNKDPRNTARYAEGEKTSGIWGAFVLNEGAAVRHFEENFIRSQLTGPKTEPSFIERYFLEESYTTMNGNPSRGFTWLGQKCHP